MGNKSGDDGKTMYSYKLLVYVLCYASSCLFVLRLTCFRVVFVFVCIASHVFSVVVVVVVVVISRARVCGGGY